MDIHHAMMVRSSPERVYEALTRPGDMQAWWGAPITGGAEVGSTIDIQFDQGRRGLKFVILRLEANSLVQWRVVQPVWPIEPVYDQVVTWTLEPFEESTLVDFRMEGWPQDDGVYASVSYKWATYMFKLKVFVGDTREIEPILPVVERLRGRRCKLVTLETDRLVIRNFKPEDWEALHEMIVQYEASGYAVYDQQWPTGAEDIQGVVGWFANGDSFLAVTLKDTGRFIGFVSLNSEQEEGVRQYNLGYIFNFNYHSKGYATEACRAVLGHAFGTLQADSVITGTAALNTASCRLLERLGFKKTAEGKGSFRNDADGKPIEFVGYTYFLARQDWQAGG